MKRARSASTQSGLTLIEVMIAIVIMATINLIAWRGIDILSRANTTLQLRSEESARLMRALQQLERDIAWHTTVELPTRSPPPPTSAESPRRVELLPPGMQITRAASGQLLLTLVRAAPAAPGQWQQVQWWMQGNTLYRAAGQPSARYPVPSPQVADRVAVLNGVASFNLRAWVAPKGWQPLPGPAFTNNGATGLEITLALRHTDGQPLSWRRVLAFN